MVPTPHDALFKAICSQIQHAREVLCTGLPPDLVRCLDFDTLRLVSASFVDDQLHDGHADLLFTVELRDAAVEIYILLEHQSTAPFLMTWRVLRYECHAWARYLQDHHQATRLPVIVPVVLYHGATPWSAPTALRELYDAPPALLAALGGHLPQLSFLLDDLVAQSDAALRGRAMGAGPTLALWALKHARHEPDMVAALRSVRDLCLAVLQAPNGKQTLGQVFRYILEVSKMQPETMSELVQTELGPEAHEAFVTGAELLRREGWKEGEKEGLKRGEKKGRKQGEKKGRKQGEKKGRKQGRCELLAEQLEQRFGPLPEEVRSRLESADIEQLSHWGRRVLVAGTLAEVFAGEP